MKGTGAAATEIRLATARHGILLAFAAASLLALPPAAEAQSEYEPNDSPIAAAGPLLIGSTYTAALERQGDRDFFFFYMASPSPVPAEVTLTNLGGSGTTSELSGTILDEVAVPIAGQTYIRAGEARTLLTEPLAPGKYYVEVAGGEGFGDDYTLLPGGPPGAFAPYEQIANRCAVARKAEARAEARLERVEADRQRTLARLRRSRHESAEVRRSARRAHRRATARLRARKRAAATAERNQEPWCSIPQ
jgi:hypothetical protein